jgi:hypothetical protein
MLKKYNIMSKKSKLHQGKFFPAPCPLRSKVTTFFSMILYLNSILAYLFFVAYISEMKYLTDPKCHMSDILGEGSWWRVCYQQSLPRLVLKNDLIPINTFIMIAFMCFFKSGLKILLKSQVFTQKMVPETGQLVSLLLLPLAWIFLIP